MKKLLPVMFPVICSLLLASCNNSQSEAKLTNTNNALANQTESTQVKSTATAVKSVTSNTSTTSQPKLEKNSQKQPRIGTVKELVNGDIMCYVTLVDEKGKTHNLGADFDICADSETYLNKKVQLTYIVGSVNDCQSAEPCGKSRQEVLINKMEIVGNQAKNSSKSDSHTISNGKWKITIGNGKSWSGVNGTGNLSYRGCDAKGRCINLTGGRVTCRDGMCTTGWVNGNFTYAIQQPMSEDGNAASTLIVRKGDKVILRETGFKVVPNRR